ncbi:hypothetical protein CROQUDRAFT_27867, partial [Cronartium quercuum f. sp. fusiforme G11]
DSAPKQARDISEEDVALCKELYRKLENIGKYNQEVDQLEHNGSNLARWKTRSAMALMLMTGVVRYWDTPKPKEESIVNQAIDKCAIRMIYTTVHTKLRDIIDQYTCAH